MLNSSPLLVRHLSLVPSKILLTSLCDEEDLSEVEYCKTELAGLEESKRKLGGQLQLHQNKDLEVLDSSKQLQAELVQIKKLQEAAKAPMQKYKMNCQKLCTSPPALLRCAMMSAD